MQRCLSIKAILIQVMLETLNIWNKLICELWLTDYVMPKFGVICKVCKELGLELASFESGGPKRPNSKLRKWVYSHLPPNSQRILDNESNSQFDYHQEIKPMKTIYY